MSAVMIRDQILSHLRGKRPQSIPQIATALGKEPTNLNRIVHDLCDAGLVTGERGVNHVIFYELAHTADDDHGGTQPAHDPGLSAPAAVSIIPRATPAPAAPQASTPAPPASPPPAPEPAPRRRRRRGLSTDDFMVTIARLREDSEKLAKIRAILAEDAPDADDGVED